MALVIDYKNVYIHQAETLVLQRVNLQVEEGSFIYLTGTVGSGKSTLLESMYGELPISSGEATMLGTYVLGKKMKDKRRQELRRQLGIIFQDFQLLGDRTIEKNLEFVLRATGWKKKAEISQRITEVLKVVDLESKRNNLPNELSGGEQQRICIARAFLNKPKLIIADEPTGNLDLQTSKNIVELLHKICELGATVVMSTHNLGLVNLYPSQIYRIEDHQLTDVTAEFNQPFDMDEFSEMD